MNRITLYLALIWVVCIMIHVKLVKLDTSDQLTKPQIKQTD